MPPVAQRPQITIALHVTRSRAGVESRFAKFTTNTYLGQDAFPKYRAALDGARFDGDTKANFAPLDKVLPILHRLKDAGFTAELAPDLRTALTELTAQRKLLVEAATGRMASIEAELAKRGLALFPFQKIGVEWLAPRKSALLADEMGCIDGAAVISYRRAELTRKLPLAELHRKFQGGESRGRVWDPDIPTYVTSLRDDGELRRHRIVNTLDKGVRAVVLLKLASGKSLRLTPDHEVRTKVGWVEAGKLCPGDVVFTNGRPKCRICGETSKVSTNAYAKFPGVCRTCDYRKLRTRGKGTGKSIDQDGYVRVSGQFGHPRRTTGGVYEHILVMEKKLGRYVTREETVHHKNGIKSDNRLSNLILTNQSDHAAHHGREGGYRRLNGTISGKGGESVFVPREDKVVSVTEDGTAHVYDIVCEDPHRNFVANGIIVHNCGKTVQVLLAMPQNSPILVICPSVLKGVWVAEAAKWRPDITCVEVLSGRGSFRWPLPHEMLIINPDILPNAVNDRGELEAPHGVLSNTTLIMDELHWAKAAKSLRTQRARVLAEAVRANGGRTWGMTATPMLNNPSETWSILQAVGAAHEAFGSYREFFDLLGGSMDKWGGVRWGSTPDASVPERLRRVSLRRDKKDVLSELPDKTLRTIEVPIDRTTKKLLDAVWKQIQAAGVDLDSAETFARMQNGQGIELETVSACRAALVTAKIPSMLEIVESFEAQNEPLVVFSRHRAPIDVLAQRDANGKKWATITGDNSKDAAQIAADFQAGRLAGVAATIQAGGVGITLTHAHNVLFVDRDWTPALNDQAEDRTHRIGQTKGVVVWDLIADHTMDKHVAKVLRKKQAIISRTIEASSIGGDVRPSNEGDELDEDAFRAAFADVVAEGSTRENSAPVVQRYAAFTAREKWAERALTVLSGLDPDGAQELNGVGFNKLDGAVGHSLAQSLLMHGALTRKQFELAIRICKKYHAQIGVCPMKTVEEEV